MGLRITKRNVIVIIVIIGLLAFLLWRFIRPMNIFVVDERFAWPIDTSQTPPSLINLRATDCAACHAVFYEEWRTSIHSQAWTDPYFQVDWAFDGSQQICKNCHIPLDRQQEHKVSGFRDKEKWQPILESNPDFDPALQHEGVTCAACHLRDGKILGIYASKDSPHPVEKLTNSNEVCVRCHVVGGERWDTFYNIPPCGTVAEIRSGQGGEIIHTGETVIGDIAALGCVECHMPLVERPLVEGGKVRSTRRHWWRGGHDPAMVKRALDIRLEEMPPPAANKKRFSLTLTNVGSTHYVPTGTPDRYISLSLRLLDAGDQIVKQKRRTLKRMILWRPFIIDLLDTRLLPGEPRRYTIDWDTRYNTSARAVEAVVRYHLLAEKRRSLIGYENDEPISYEIYRRRIAIINTPSGKETIASAPGPSQKPGQSVFTYYADK
jgi:hypothetical protein